MLSTAAVLQALKPLLDDSVVVAALGNTCRELFVLGDRTENFYMLGAMGSTIPVGLGIAIGQRMTVVAIEGDGGCLMNLGSLATVANIAASNLKIIILDNRSYQSTGGQPSATAGRTSLAAIARGCGIADVLNVEEDVARLLEWLSQPGLRLCVVAVEAQTVKANRVPLEPAIIFKRLRERLVRANDREGVWL